VKHILALTVLGCLSSGAFADGWVKHIDTPASPAKVEVWYAYSGPAGSTFTAYFQSKSECYNTGAPVTPLAPYTSFFETMFYNTWDHELQIVVPSSGSGSGFVWAENAWGSRRAVQGWKYMTGQTSQHEQSRFLQWFIYELPVGAGGS
jgi:hypothetical protein